MPHPRAGSGASLPWFVGNILDCIGAEQDRENPANLKWLRDADDDADDDNADGDDAADADAGGGA